MCPVVGVMVPMVVTMVLFELRAFFFWWPIVSVVVMGFVGFFWWWLAVGGQQRRERDVVGVEGREVRDEEEDRERGEKKNFKNKIKN